MKQGNGRIERTARSKMAEQGLELRDFVLSRYDNGDAYPSIVSAIFRMTGLLVDSALVRQWVKKWRLQEAAVEVTAK